MRSLILLALCLAASVSHAQVARSNATAYEPIATTAIPITTTATLTTATLSSDTLIYRFVGTVDAHIAFGPSPTATTSSTFLPAYSVEVFPVSDNMRASVRAASGSGTFFIDRLKK
jgi:hypothetical protein